jgi:hypothetical protein
MYNPAIMRPGVTVSATPSQKEMAVVMMVDRETEKIICDDGSVYIKYFLEKKPYEIVKRRKDLDVKKEDMGQVIKDMNSGAGFEKWGKI